MKINSPTLHEFKLFRDKGDPWGSAMILFFEVADYLNSERDAEIPTEWGFRPGMSPDPGEYWEMLTEETTENLIKLGNLLNRYTNWLDAKGLSY